MNYLYLVKHFVNYFNSHFQIVIFLIIMHHQLNKKQSKTSIIQIFHQLLNEAFQIKESQNLCSLQIIKVSQYLKEKSHLSVIQLRKTNQHIVNQVILKKSLNNVITIYHENLSSHRWIPEVSFVTFPSLNLTDVIYQLD